MILITKQSLRILPNWPLSKKVLQDSIQPRIHFPNLLLIMTNERVPGQQYQYNRHPLLVEMTTPLKDWNKKLPMWQERKKIWKQVPRQQHHLTRKLLVA
jgi:hypothetical protein